MKDQRLERDFRRNIRLRTPTVAYSSPSLIAIQMDWDKYKEYLYANFQPNTARLALKYGNKEWKDYLDQQDFRLDLEYRNKVREGYLRRSIVDIYNNLGVSYFELEKL